MAALLNPRDRRLHPRRNTMIVAVAVFDAGRTRVGCVIRDISEGGAKIEFPTVRGIPQTFDLQIPGHPTRACRVAWRALKELGVQFL